MFACPQCRDDLKSVEQVGRDPAGDFYQRRIRVVFRPGSKASGPSIFFQQMAWVKTSEPKDEGFYCPSCHRPLNLPVELTRQLSDTPASLVDPADFSSAPYLAAIQSKVQAQEVARRVFPPRDASFGDGGRFIDPRLQKALQRMGVIDGRLWSHQVEALSAITSGRNVAIVTSTASGKTLCFNVPVFREILRNRDTTAIYLYPTKALAQDQIQKITRFDDEFVEGETLPQQGSFFRLNIGGSPLTVGKYDGSTPEFEREFMRREEAPNILMTNPDMLHFGILRNNGAWSDFLSHLRFVVVDEIHAYRGVFGSHVALVLRRLRKICDLCGASPQFILCSATVGNPLEHARLLTGLSDIVLVDRDGSPVKSRMIILLNPPSLEASPTERTEPVTVAVDILSRSLLATKKPAKTIVFGRSRWAVKSAYRILRRRLEENRSTRHASSLVREYTATLTPSRREELASEIASGNVAAVIATNALELGIDVGDISAAVVIGYPGSVASLQQEFGRAGRRGEGLGVLVLQNNPLEQYYARHGEEFFDRAPEVVRINPLNRQILAMHLNCAVYETQERGGLSSMDIHDYFGLDAREAGSLLESVPSISKRLENGEGRFVWEGNKPEYRAIRNPLTKRQFDIMCGRDRVGVMDDASVLRDLFPGAVWTDQDRQFVVRALDFDSGIAEVTEKELDYYTVAMPRDKLDIVSTTRTGAVGPSSINLGRLRWTRRVELYKKVPHAGSHKPEVVHISGAKNLPSLEYETDGTWLRLTRSALGANSMRGDAAVHALEHAVVAMMPRFIDCDPSDLGGLSRTSTEGEATLFVFDAFSGGVGFSEVFFDQPVPILERVKGLIRSCSCTEDSGCPACIQSPRCWDEERGLSKSAALEVLGAMGV